MLEQIIIFVVFLGPLVFFHELGHFFFARLFGVRVETFSIGFGPKLFTFKKGDTDYAISLIPLGGYVKMFGDDPLSETELTEEEAKYAYTTKSKWARFWIVFGGPLANFLLAFVIYANLIFLGEKVPETRFGALKETSKLYSIGVRSGDILKKINDLEIISFDDLNLVDSNVSSITIQRNEKVSKLPLKMNGIEFVKDFAQNGGQLRASIVIDKDGKSFLVNNTERSFESLIEAKLKSANLYPIESDLSKIKSLEEIKYSKNAITIPIKDGLVTDLWKKSYYPKDLMVDSIVMNSAAEAAGLKKNDIIIGLNGNRLSSFEDLRSNLLRINKEEEVILKVLDKNGERIVKLTPRFTMHNEQKLLTIGVYSGVVPYPPKIIEVREKDFFPAMAKAFNRTIENTVKVLQGFKRLITGEVSIKNIGGPIAIGKVASDSFNISLSMFFRLMALISLNLGIINLFPIPVLDGGHIVIIFYESIVRGPISKKKLIIAQQLGVSLLFLLIFIALFNDISRFF